MFLTGSQAISSMFVATKRGYFKLKNVFLILSVLGSMIELIIEPKETTFFNLSLLLQKSPFPPYIVAIRLHSNTGERK